jgi:DNA-binding PadR family transcriptional regulator
MASIGYPPHGRDCPRRSATSHISRRFLEPVLLLMLKEKGHSHGYGLFKQFSGYALTNAQIERPAFYRILNALEASGFLTSRPDIVDSAGPERRVYFLTRTGESRLHEWADVLEQLGDAIKGFARKAK